MTITDIIRLHDLDRRTRRCVRCGVSQKELFVSAEPVPCRLAMTTPEIVEHYRQQAVEARAETIRSFEEIVRGHWRLVAQAQGTYLYEHAPEADSPLTIEQP